MAESNRTRSETISRREARGDALAWPFSSPPPPISPRAKATSGWPPPNEAHDADEAVYELLWSEPGDHATIKNAKRWVEDRRTSRRSVLRQGPKAMLPPPSHAWFARGRHVSVRQLVEAAGWGMGEDDGAMATPARVVVAQLLVDVSPAAEVEAVRASLQCVAGRHKSIEHALQSTAAVEDAALLPNDVYRAALEQLYTSARMGGLDAEQLRDTVRRTVVRDRRFNELALLGGEHVVARLADDDGAALVAYLPKNAANALPLERCFGVRAVVSVHPRQDPEESGAWALRIAALARVHHPVTQRADALAV